MRQYQILPFTSVYTNPSRCVPEAGDTIGPFKVIAQVGFGSFGLVYKVADAQGRIFALKLIKLYEIAFESERKNMLSRFEREFSISQIDSPYIVKSYECGMLEGNPFFTMDFCPGGSLESWKGRAIYPAAYDKMAFEVLSGLKVIHEHGFFHRDIKPQNVLITGDGDAKLTDFGIAGHKTSRLTSVSHFGKVDQIFGTWAYIAPEQANNKIAFKALDAVSDIYSFGIMMFEVFTGEYPFPPYQITSQPELLTYVEEAAKGNAANFERSGRYIPDHWKKIIKKCIEPDYKNKRYTEVAAIIKDMGFKVETTVTTITTGEMTGTTLKITYGDEFGRIINLDRTASKAGRTRLTLGRKDPYVINDITIDEVTSTYISRRHATLEKEAATNKWIIRDGQFHEMEWAPSLNNTYVNSSAIPPGGVYLSAGDTISMGDTIIKVIQN